MKERIETELKLLRKAFPDTEYREEGYWFRIPAYLVPDGIWNVDKVAVAFQAPVGYPGQPPYAFYVQPGLRVKGTDQKPNNYEEPASGVPFEGVWAKFSWQHELWRPTADISSGSNLLNYVRTFADRFREGV